MIAVNQAYNTALADAQREYGAVALISCTDIGDGYAFAFGAEGEPIIGAPVFVVDKESGALSYLNIPPRENLALLKSGKRIDVFSINVTSGKGCS
jgi:hypothetical protein